MFIDRRSQLNKLNGIVEITDKIFTVGLHKPDGETTLFSMSEEKFKNFIADIENKEYLTSTLFGQNSKVRLVYKEKNRDIFLLGFNEGVYSSFTQIQNGELSERFGLDWTKKIKYFCVYPVTQTNRFVNK